MSLYEESIRQLAYQIWKSEGQPDGQHERHWQMAREQIDTSLAETSSVPAPATGPGTKKKRAAVQADETQLAQPGVLGQPPAAKKPGAKAPASKPRSVAGAKPAAKARKPKTPPGNDRP